MNGGSAKAKGSRRGSEVRGEEGQVILNTYENNIRESATQ